MTPASLGPHQVTALSRTLSVCPDPVALFALCCDQGRAADTLLLESADQTTKSGQKSLLLTSAALRLHCRDREVQVQALSPNGTSVLPWLADALRDRATIELTEKQLIAQFPPIDSGSEDQRLTAASPLDALRYALLNLEVVGGEPSLPPLVAGSLAYDLLSVYEQLPPAQHDPSAWPDYEFWLAEELLWIDHRTRRCTATRYVFGGKHAEAAYHDASAALATLIDHCQNVPSEHATTVPAIRPINEVPCDVDDATFAAHVDELKKHIVDGDVFQIVPSRSFSLPCPEPLSAYRQLRQLNPSPYMFYLNGSAGILFGASPESALTVKGSPKRATISPIAGTRARGRDAAGRIDADLDTRIEAELRLDKKEVAEHVMLVDLARNDVARISEAGTRSVDDLMQVVRYSHVMHLVSTVSGELRHDLDALHAYVATMNMGTLVGAPKLKAAELLRKYEPNRRGPYGGSVGYLRADGEFDTCIVIRSAIVRDNIAHVRAGCGVVFDSVPQEEADETRRKAAAVLGALQQATSPEVHG